MSYWNSWNCRHAVIPHLNKCLSSYIYLSAFMCSDVLANYCSVMHLTRKRYFFLMHWFTDTTEAEEGIRNPIIKLFDLGFTGNCECMDCKLNSTFLHIIFDSLSLYLCVRACVRVHVRACVSTWVCVCVCVCALALNIIRCSILQRLSRAERNSV